MKKQVCLLGILCLIGLESQLNTPGFANTVEESRKPPIKDFVRSLHPHGVSMAAALQYKSESPASRRDNIRKLLELLEKEDEKPNWSTIVVTLSIIADPSAIPEVISFIEKLEQKPRLDHFDYRALSSAIWALGILINLGAVTDPAHREVEEASKFLIKKSQGKKETTFDQQPGFPSPAHQPENGNNNGTNIGDLIQRSAILGLAFAGTEVTKEVLSKIYKEARDTRFKKFLEQVMRAEQKINKIGLFCYREPQSPSCP